MSKPKAVVLLSGGLDSCVTLAQAISEGYECHPLNVLYGQRHSRERTSALAIAALYGLDVQLLQVEGFGKMVSPGTVLTDTSKEVPGNRSDAEMSEGKAPSYVPGRNTVMFALAQSYAEAIGAHAIFTGVNAVDYSGYVDCRPEFVAAWNELAEVSTFAGIDGNPIIVYAPLITLSKEAIVHTGLDLSAPLHLSWSCYKGGETPCNVCDSCIIRNAAFAANGMKDPAVKE